MNTPKGVVVAITLAMLTTGCLSASGGSSENVPLNDLSTNPTIRIEWPQMTLTIPPSNAASVGSVLPKVKVEGDNVLIEAKYVLREKPATATFNLSKLGLAKEEVPSLKVFWVNPDGTKKQLQLEKPGEK